MSSIQSSSQDAIGLVETTTFETTTMPAGFLVLDRVFHGMLVAWHTLPGHFPSDYDVMEAAAQGPRINLRETDRTCDQIDQTNRTRDVSNELTSLRRQIEFEFAGKSCVAHFWVLEVGPKVLELGPKVLDLGPKVLELGPLALGPELAHAAQEQLGDADREDASYRFYDARVSVPLLFKIGLPQDMKELDLDVKRVPASRLAFGSEAGLTTFQWSMTLSDLSAQLPVLSCWVESFFEGYLAEAPQSVQVEVAGDCQYAEIRLQSGPIHLTVDFSPQF
jgi:hypothetical protein